MLEVAGLQSSIYPRGEEVKSAKPEAIELDDQLQEVRLLSHARDQRLQVNALKDRELIHEELE